MKKVIITEASGFVGRNLIDRFLKENVKVFAISRMNKRPIFFHKMLFGFLMICYQ
jgi:nucleoside-diphosphate-sugar epimerase